jgi:hypothetical protein
VNDPREGHASALSHSLVRLHSSDETATRGKKREKYLKINKFHASPVARALEQRRPYEIYYVLRLLIFSALKAPLDERREKFDSNEEEEALLIRFEN